MVSIFDFIVNNSSLVLLSFFGFLSFYKGIPFLIKSNETKHSKTEKKLTEIDSKLNTHIFESKNNVNILEKDIKEIEIDIDNIQKSIKKIEEYQHNQKGTMGAIETMILNDWGPKNKK